MIKNGDQSGEFEGGYWLSRILPSVGVGEEESLLIYLQKIFYLPSPLLCKTPPLTSLALFSNPWRDCLILLILQGFPKTKVSFFTTCRVEPKANLVSGKLARLCAMVSSFISGGGERSLYNKFFLKCFRVIWTCISTS